MKTWLKQTPKNSESIGNKKTSTLKEESQKRKQKKNVTRKMFQNYIRKI